MPWATASGDFRQEEGAADTVQHSVRVYVQLAVRCGLTLLYNHPLLFYHPAPPSPAPSLATPFALMFPPGGWSGWVLCGPPTTPGTAARVVRSVRSVQSTGNRDGDCTVCSFTFALFTFFFAPFTFSRLFTFNHQGGARPFKPRGPFPPKLATPPVPEQFQSSFQFGWKIQFG